MNKKRLLIIAISVVIIILSIYFWNKLYNSNNSEIVNNQSNKVEKKVYNHTFAERISKSDYFKWEFISNDIASIYPRREALVRDILVDIWDSVKVWDTLATLFNPWVWWEGQSKINLKDTVVSSKNNLLVEAKKVKEAKVEELEQKIKEKEVILEETIKNFDSKISQIWNQETLWSEYQVTLKSLENLEKNLENALKTKEELLKESSNNISQKQDLLNSKMDELYNKIIPVLYIWNEVDIDYREIKTYDFSDYFWAKSSMSVSDLKDVLISFHNNYDILEVNEKYEKLIDINNKLIVVLQNTIVSVSAWTTESIISSHISDINTYNTTLISQKEVLDDALNNYRVLELTQKEKIENIELQISKKENELTLILAKSGTTQSEKQLVISKLKAEIETLKKSKNLLVANEDKTITSLENEIAIAKADLNSEYIKSWDYKIVSPFSWVISKRWIEIWEKISPNNEAFRVSWVDTTLSRITKKEVKFYVPENLKDSVEIWNEIYFYYWDDETKTFTWTLYRISPEIDTETLSIIAQAKVDDNTLIPNKSTIRVQLETTKDIFKIPSSTIYNKDERKIVYYKKDNWKLWVKDINIVSDDWEYSLVSWNFDETLKIVTTPIFIK